MNQTRKLLLQLAAMVAIAGALGGYAWFGVFKKDEEKAKREDHDLRLFVPQKLGERALDGGAAPGDFTRLRITVKDATTELERVGGQWWLVKPVRARADRLVVDALLSQLQTSKFKDTLEEAPDAAVLAKYGLEPPQFVVEATAVVNGETRQVRLVGGFENTFDGSVYVRRDQEAPVFTAEGGVRFALAKTTSELRDKSTFAVEEQKVAKIAVKTLNNTFTLERDPGSRQWNLTAPTREPADAPSVSTMLASAAQERAQDFPEDTPANRQALGFDVPMIDVSLTLEDAGVVRLRATRQGADAGHDGERDVFYGLREDADGSALAQLGKGVMEFDRNPADLRDRTVVRFRRELVTKIVLHDPASGPDVVLERDSVDASAESWRVVAPRAGKAKVFKVTGALWTLGSFKALAPGEEHPKDWGKYGLGAGAKYVAVFGGDGQELARLSIGKEVIGTPSAFYVRGTRDQVLQSDGSRFGELPFRLADVLDEPPADAGR